jgi:DNA-binding response OmpR family regulator/two-component sensor histidine kinase
MKYIIESFHSYAESKRIRLRFLTELKQIHMDYEPEKMLTIVSNLLSNAIKYTPEGGEIYVAASTLQLPVGNRQVKHKLSATTTKSLLLSVKDSGIGIPPDKLAHIFDRFYQADDEATRKGEGTGIGLAMTKELVKLLNGEISVQSTPGEGTKFTLILPITQTAAPLETVDGLSVKEKATSFVQTAVKYPEKSAVIKGSDELPLLLIIEDNKDVVFYLGSCLEEDYRLVVACNGQQGIDKALEIIPDLIVSDVMMPLKDGYEVCMTLKNDERTSHIPIILLTAKADVVSRMEGLETGADAYMAKPFHKEELLVRAKNLVEMRQKLQQHYLNVSGLASTDTRLTGAVLLEEAEHVFVKKVRRLVEEHMDEYNFTVKQLCREIGMSHSQLHRKLTALIGFSTNKFMRRIRLNKAKDLLMQTTETIAAIAYDTGFADPDYFSRAFKKEFGLTPTEFKKNLVDAD